MCRKRRAALLTFIVLVFFAGTSHAFAATWYANSSTGSDTTGDGSSGNPFATFSKAYNAAATSGDTINLTGTFNEANTAESSSTANSGFVLNKNLTIVGQGIGSTIVEASSTYGTANRSVFFVQAGKTVTIKNMTIRYGVALYGNGAGGITNDGILTLINDDVTSNYFNTTQNYGAGGIYTDTGTASTTVASSTVENNSFNGGYYGGGGFFVYGNSSTVNLTILNSTISNNAATTTDSTPYEYAGAAGGIGTFRFSALTVANSTIAHNTTNAYAGGLMLYLSPQSITNSTIADNYAAKGGGGIVWTSSTGDKLYLENDLIANNTTATTTNDFYAHDTASASLVQDNGYNSVGYSSGYTFTSSTDITGVSSGSHLSSTLALNGSTQGPQTLALLAGSPEINAGTTTPNDGVSISRIDERGATRNGAVDIGAFEYGGGGITDTTPPVVLVTAPAANTLVTGTTPLTASASDDVAVAGVTFYVDGIQQGSEITSSPYTYLWNTNATTTGSHSVFAVARDTSNNYATSSPVSFMVGVPDTTPPVLSAIASSTTVTTATITWTTDEAATSTVSYGSSTSYGFASTSPALVTSHSITLTGLTGSTTYHFQIGSSDASGNVATSSDMTFTTAVAPDITPPTVSLTFPTATSTQSGVITLQATAADNNAVAGVKFFVDGVQQGSEITTAPYSGTWDSSATTTGTHTAFAVARDTSNNYATSTVVSFTVTGTPLTFSGAAAGTTNHSVTLDWLTNILSSSFVYFGPTSSYGTSTPEIDTSPRLTGHAVTIPNLLSCTMYHYALAGTTAQGITATSTDTTFTTTGCAGTAQIVASTTAPIMVSSGGTTSLSSGSDSLAVTIPAASTATTTSFMIQVKALDGIGNLGLPSASLQTVGNIAFDVKAVIDASTTLDSFNAPVTIVAHYTSADTVGVIESSLIMYHYHGGAWLPLTGCVIDTTAKTVTCTTPSFSTFALFGTPIPTTTTNTSSTQSIGGSYNGGGTSITQQVKNLIAMGKVQAALSIEAQWPSLFPAVSATASLGTSSSTSDTLSTLGFTRSLQFGSTGTDVLALQQYLNAHGFTIATSGAGSAGNETTYFGKATRAALAKFQKANGIMPASGYFGPLTRAYIAAHS